MLLKLKNRVVNNKEREREREKERMRGLKNTLQKKNLRETYIYEVIKQS